MSLCMSCGPACLPDRVFLRVVWAVEVGYKVIGLKAMMSLIRPGTSHPNLNSFIKALSLTYMALTLTLYPMSTVSLKKLDHVQSILGARLRRREPRGIADDRPTDRPTDRGATR